MNLLFKSCVLKDIPLEQLLQSVHTIKDEILNAQVGYSFLTDPENGLDSRASALLTALVQHPLWGKAMGEKNAAGNFEWDRDTLTEWLDNVRELKESMFFNLVFSGILPAHTVAMGLRFANGKTEKRNLFSTGNRLFWMEAVFTVEGGTFWFPSGFPNGLENMIINYLTVVRPMERTLASVICEPDIAALYETHLWTGPEGIWDCKQVDKILEKKSLTYLGERIDFDTWGNISLAISQRHIAPNVRMHPELSKICTSVLTHEYFVILMGKTPKQSIDEPFMSSDLFEAKLMVRKLVLHGSSLTLLR